MSVCGVGMGELHPSPWKRVCWDGALFSPAFLVLKADTVSAIPVMSAELVQLIQQPQLLLLQPDARLPGFWYTWTC